MRRHRYMIVEHPRSAEQHHPSKKFEDFVLPIHTLLGTYHWARLDDGHVLVTGHYETSHHSALSTHPKTTMLPPLGASKTLKAHMASRSTHWKALSAKLSLSASATSSDVAEAAEAAFGVLFGAPQ